MIQTLTIDAFAQTPETLAQFKACAADRRMGKSRMGVMNGGLEAAIAHYAAASTPKVILVEDDDMENLDRLADVCDPGTRVIVVGSVNDIQFYRSLVARGVAEYLLRPVSSGQILETLDRLFADPGAAPKGKVVAFWGARGGVGSSSLAQNTAWLLGQHLRQAILYLDCDANFGTSQLVLTQDAKQTFADVVGHGDQLDHMLVDRSLINCGDYLRVLASPGDLKPRPPVDVDAMTRLIATVQRMAPMVVVDLPHHWTDWTEHVLALSSEVVVSAHPDFASLRNLKTVMETVETPLKLVLNGMDACKRTQLSADDFEKTLSVKPVLSIPFDPVLFGEATNNGQIAAQAAPAHKVVKLMAGLAETFAGKPVRKDGPKWGGLPLDLLKWVRA